MRNEHDALSFFAFGKNKFATIGVSSAIRFDFPFVFLHILPKEFDDFVHLVVRGSEAHDEKILIETGAKSLDLVRNGKILGAARGNVLAAPSSRKKQGQKADQARNETVVSHSIHVG